MIYKMKASPFRVVPFILRKVYKGAVAFLKCCVIFDVEQAKVRRVEITAGNGGKI